MAKFRYSMLRGNEKNRSHWCQAWKLVDNTDRLINCDWDDPNAMYFDVTYPGATAHDKIRFEDRYLAYQVFRGLIDSFEEGGLRKIQEFKQFLEIDS